MHCTTLRQTDRQTREAERILTVPSRHASFLLRYFKHYSPKLSSLCTFRIKIAYTFFVSPLFYPSSRAIMCVICFPPEVTRFKSETQLTCLGCTGYSSVSPFFRKVSRPIINFMSSFAPGYKA